MYKSIHTEKQKQLCTLLIEKRKQAGLTQTTVAKRLGKPQSFVSKYEGDERRLDIIELIAVAKAIGFDPKQVIGELE